MDTAHLKRVIKNFVTDADDIEMLGIERGEYNKAYLVSIGSDKYALRIKKKPVRLIPLDTEYEAEFMEKLENTQTTIHIPKTMRTIAGNLLYEDADAYYNLQTLVPGGRRIEKWYRSHELGLEDIQEIFSKLALLHNACRTIHMSATKKSPTVLEYISDYRSMLRGGLPAGEFNDALAEQHDFLESNLNVLEHSLRELEYEKCKKYPTHYDTSAMNVLWERGRIASLIDFDWAQDSTLEFDFCHSAMHSCGGYTVGGSSDNLFDENKVRAAFESYNRVANAPFENRKLIAALLDASSFFLAFWGVKTFMDEKSKESYYLGFFRAGVDRLKSPVQFA